MNQSRPTWRKSSYSGVHGSCVEVAVTRHTHEAAGDLLVRDSKDPDGPVLALTPAQWQAFVTGIKNGEFGASA